MHLPPLALSLLGAEIKALGFRRGKLSGQWESPQPWDEAEDLARLLVEATSRTGADGREIAIVLAHPRLNDQVLEIPPAKGWTLDRLLERQAQSTKTFPGTAVWSRQAALPTKRNNAILLHLLPRTTLDNLTFACQKAHLRLVRVLPTSAVLIGQLKALPLEKDAMAVLVGVTGLSTTIVIGSKDGRVALARVLAHNWVTAPERVWIDLTRSIGFAEQQCGAPVTSAWLFGPDAEGQLPTVQAIVKIPAKVSPVEYHPLYWAEQARQLPEKNDGNLVSIEVRHAPQRRRMLVATAVILVLLLLMSFGAAGAVEVVRQLELSSVREIERLIARVQEQKKAWQQRYAQAEMKNQLVRLVTEQRLPPVPVWFLGFLSEVLPDNLVVTDLRVVQTGDSWQLRIAGSAQPDALVTSEVTAALARDFPILTNKLATGPFRVLMTNTICGASERGPEGSQSKRTARAPAISSARPAESGPQADSRFLIEGIIR